MMHILICRDLRQFDFQINVTQKGLEKYASFSLANKLVFIDGFQSLSSSFDGLVWNLVESGCKYSSEEFDSEILDLVEQKAFYPCECMCNFKKC